MARLNIDDEFWTDPRFKALAALLGNERTAMGTCLEFWFVAQKYWKDGEKLIPKRIFQLGKFEPLLEVDLAEEREEGIYCRGAKERFAWLMQKITAGKKSSEARKEKSSINNTRTDVERDANGSSTERQRNPTDVERDANGSEPLTLTLPLTLSVKNNSLNIKKVRNKKIEENIFVPSCERDAYPPQNLMNLWNTHCGILPKAQKLSGSRLQKAKARLQSEADLSIWETVIKKIAASHFCTGGNPTGWRADFDFLVKPDTLHRTLEGKYDNHKPVVVVGHDDQFYKDLYEKVEKEEENERLGLSKGY